MIAQSLCKDEQGVESTCYYNTIIDLSNMPDHFRTKQVETFEKMNWPIPDISIVVRDIEKRRSDIDTLGTPSSQNPTLEQ
jgi:hypothetical protein